MSVFLIDTNVVIRAVKDREPVLKSGITAAIGSGHELALSVISLLELHVGVLWHASPDAAELRLNIHS